jgi:hypothetical protein
LHQQSQFNRVRHFRIRFRRFETNFYRRKIDIVLNFERKTVGASASRLARRDRCRSIYNLDPLRSAQRLLRVSEVLLNDCAQFDFIAITQKRGSAALISSGLKLSLSRSRHRRISSPSVADRGRRDTS